MLKRVHIKNYKSLQDVEVELSPFTVLIGPNNAGKSNFLGALRYLSDFLGRRKRASFSSIVWQGDISREIEIHVEGDMPYEEKEVLGFTYDTFSADSHEREQHSGQIPVGIIQQTIASWHFYNLDPAAMRTSDAADVSMPVLESRGSNLAAVLDSFASVHRQSLKWLETTLQRAIPEAEGIRLLPTSNGKKVVSVMEKNGKSIIEAGSLSDGVLRFLALLSLVYHPQPPPLICIEEPENGIHPRRLEKVVDLLKWLSTERTPEQRAQVIVTTHSPMFLDWFRDHPEWVWVVERDAEGTHFKPLKDVPHLDQLLYDFSLGEAWYGGSIGGVP